MSCTPFRSHKVNKILLALINITILILSLISEAIAAELSQECDKNQCIAVIDAGSSGSRLHIYQLTPKSNHHNQIQEIFTKKISPGISSIDANDKSITQYMDELMSSVGKTELSMYFYATAGMRLLPQSEQQKKYKLLANWFKPHSNIRVLDIRTISGQDEAMFGWAADAWQRAATGIDPSTVGMMDFGGASVEIAFPQASNEGDNIREVNLLGKTYYLFVDSFLGLGQSEVLRQFLANPSCFPVGYPLPDDKLGTGNALSCQHDSDTFIKFHHVSESVKDVLSSTAELIWDMSGSLVYMLNSEPFKSSNEPVTTDSLFHKGKTDICEQNWPELQSAFPDDTYIYQYCLNAVVYSTLITNGYGISPASTIYSSSSQANIDWALGVVILKQ
jgi:hypothetical protein